MQTNGRHRQLHPEVSSRNREAAVQSGFAADRRLTDALPTDPAACRRSPSAEEQSFGAITLNDQNGSKAPVDGSATFDP